MNIFNVCWRASACSEAPASCRVSASSPLYRLAEYVAFAAVVMPELKFGQVQRQILLTDMVIGTYDAALEQRPERIKIRGMDFATHILASRMVDRLVRIAQCVQVMITSKIVGRDEINLVTDSLANESIERARPCILYHLANDVALAADRANDANLAGADAAPPEMLALAGVFVLFLPTDEGLVHFDDAHELAKLRIVHRGAEPVTYIQRSRIGRSNLALNLHRADAFLGVEHAPEHFKPRAKGKLRVLKDGPDQEREAIGVAASALTVRAFPFPQLIDVVDRLRLPATRAARMPVWPTMKEEVLAA
jgi:hypothetical protein